MEAITSVEERLVEQSNGGGDTLGLQVKNHVFEARRTMMKLHNNVLSRIFNADMFQALHTPVCLMFLISRSYKTFLFSFLISLMLAVHDGLISPFSGVVILLYIDLQNTKL